VYRVGRGLDGTDGTYRTYGLGMWELGRGIGDFETEEEGIEEGDSKVPPP
jgi:hypothetical protein